MFQRLRRPSTLLLALLLPAAFTLAACGGGGAAKQYTGLKAVTISGDVGSAPTLDWKGIMKPGPIKTTVVTEGSGATLAEGSRVQVDWTLVNGYTHDVLLDTYDQYRTSTVVTVGGEPRPVTVDDILASVVASQIKAGQKVGSRLAVTVGSDRLVGPYLQQGSDPGFATMGIGNQDGLLFVADLTTPAAPQGKSIKAPAWAPKIVEKDDVPSSLDFAKVGQPSGKLEVATLVQGDGPKVKAGQQVAVSYLGQFPKGKKPFDENFSTGGAYVTQVGPKATGSIQGWLRGLVGVRVGSRILLEVPPSLGYGKKPQKDQQGKVVIPGNSTLYFVIDVLDVSDVKPTPKPETAPPSEPGAPAPGSVETK